MPDVENQPIPIAAHETWRTWLMTGNRRTPVDRRRLRGAHKGLKKILVEGLTPEGRDPRVWKDFSGAMVRHAVDDAMRALPPEDTRVVKLAYFGGYSNRQIAQVVGLTEATVQRRLSRALTAISDHIQHGQTIARRALYGLVGFMSGRWLSESAHHMWTATAVAGAAVVIVAAQPASEAMISRPPLGAGAAAPRVVPPVPSPTVPVKVQPARSQPASVPAVPGAVIVSANLSPVRIPAVSVPGLKLPVTLPAVTPLPAKVKKLV